MSSLIEVSKFETGMVLAAPILNRYGQVLLGAGVELQENHKKLFLTWGIKLITIKNENGKDEIVITDEMKEQAEKIFSDRINWKPTSSYEKDLFEMGVKRVLMNLSKRKS
ncbi:MAG: hypothetical protein KJ571_04500 [Bacteroidetes bacterium]|nr:hypothetical protein [Bacteroidota bacterium]